MPRIVWFNEASRRNRRGIPLTVVWVSPRQLSILFFSFLVGLVFSAPFPAQVIKLILVGSFLSLGVAMSFWPTKMLTPEQLIMVRLRGLTRVPRLGEKGTLRDKAMKLRRMVRLRWMTRVSRPGERIPVEAKAADVIEKPEESAFEIEADSADSFAPLSISGRWRRTKLPRKVSLYVDGVPRAGAEALATPVNDSESGYTILFLPTSTDMGVRELEVRIEGEERPIYRRKVKVKVKGTRSREMKKVP